MKNKSAMGTNPLDVLIPIGRTFEQKEVTPPRENKEEEQGKGGRVRATFQIGLETLNRARNAVYWTPGITLADLVEEALIEKVTLIEKERGEPFPERNKSLKRGRPVGR